MLERHGRLANDASIGRHDVLCKNSIDEELLNQLDGLLFCNTTCFLRYAKILYVHMGGSRPLSPGAGLERWL
jgi:hypothetical protein